MDKRDWQRIVQIKAHCEDAASFIQRAGNDYERFIGDRLFFNAVCMSILQIGESANGLSEAYRAATSDRMPWDMIRGMRNWPAHAYGEVDEEMIWETVTKDLPMVLVFCESELSE